MNVQSDLSTGPEADGPNGVAASLSTIFLAGLLPPLFGAASGYWNAVVACGLIAGWTALFLRLKTVVVKADTSSSHQSSARFVTRSSTTISLLASSIAAVGAVALVGTNDPLPAVPRAATTAASVPIPTGSDLIVLSGQDSDRKVQFAVQATAPSPGELTAQLRDSDFVCDGVTRNLAVVSGFIAGEAVEYELVTVPAMLQELIATPADEGGQKHLRWVCSGEPSREVNLIVNGVETERSIVLTFNLVEPPNAD